MEQKEKRKSTFLGVVGFFLCAFLGGITAQLIISTAPAQAFGESWQRFMTIKDEENPYGVQTFVQRGGTAQKFFDPSGQVRLQMGTYPNGPDAGLPMIALTDEKGRIKVVLRLSGERQVPTLAFKDGNGKDRLIMGLEDMMGEEPYLTTYDSSGQPLIRFNKLR